MIATAPAAETGLAGIEKIQKRQRARRGGARGGRRVFRGRGVRDGRQYLGRRYGGFRRPYNRRSRGNIGAAIAAGAIGATIAGIIANSGMSRANYHAACDPKHKTYDPRTGTFKGYYGKRHYCRL